MSTNHYWSRDFEAKRYRWVTRIVYSLIGCLAFSLPVLLPAASFRVTVRSFSYSPNILTIGGGDTVTWTNSSLDTHTVTSDTGSWNAAVLFSGQTFTRTFTQGGAYAYHSDFHSTMKGSVIVQEKPNLQPRPALGWPDSLVISTIPGATIDDPNITEAQNINLAYAFANTSANTDIAQPFLVYILLDGTVRLTQAYSAMPKGTMALATTNNIGRLPVGTHTLRVELDPTLVIAESDETDNVYEKAFVVKPLTTINSKSIAIRNTSFDPALLAVDVGSIILWTNYDQTLHSSTSDTGLWDSGTLSQGQSFSFTLNQAGTFTYHCNFHSQMKGTIVVTGPANPTFQLSIPSRTLDGSLLFTIVGPISTRFTLQTSTNLMQWTVLQTVTNTTSQYPFTDMNALQFSQRFYRAILVP